MTHDWIAELSRALGADRVSTSHAVLDQHARGESFDRSVRPDLVAFPESTADVVQVMCFANEHGVPVTPVAVNSSLEGYTVPVRGGDGLDVTRMDRIVAFHPEEMTIFLEFHGNEAGLQQDAPLARDLALDMGARAFEASTDTDPAERARLWEARHNTYYAMLAANPGAGNLTTHVAVPISQLPDAVGRALAACEREGLEASLVGHVGDGNFHVLVLFRGDAERAAAERVSHEMVGHALDVGGTSTGEHGIGVRKLGYMEREHGASLETMKQIKCSLDPNDIMNPGKKVRT